MATALTQAQNPGANIGDINTSLASLGKQLTDAVNSASFNGLNILNGSLTSLSFVSGYNASATGGTINAIGFTASGAVRPGDRRQFDVHDKPVDRHRRGDDGSAADSSGPPTPRIRRPSPPARSRRRMARPQSTRTRPIRPSPSSHWLWTARRRRPRTRRSTPTVIPLRRDGTPTFATAASYAVTTTVTTPGSQNLLVQNGQDLTELQHHSARARLTAGWPRSTRRLPPSPTTPRRSARRRTG